MLFLLQRNRVAAWLQRQLKANVQDAKQHGRVITHPPDLISLQSLATCSLLHSLSLCMRYSQLPYYKIFLLFRSTYYAYGNS